MSHDAVPPVYEEVDRALRGLDSPPDSAEVHGHLLGCAAAGMLELDVWLDRLMDELSTGALPAEVRSVLAALYTHTATRISQGQLDLVLLLPDDDTPLADRVEALGQWCQGFLSGYGLSVAAADQRTGPEAAAEIDTVLRDIAAISQVGLGDDAEERDLFELAEYVRLAAAQLCADNWMGRIPRPSASAGEAATPEGLDAPRQDDETATRNDPSRLFRRGPLH